MRIVAWNCAMALHRKIDSLLSLRPDVAIIPEAAAPERLVGRAAALTDASLVWIGKNSNKGLLIAGFGPTVLDMSPHRYDSRLHWMAPVAVNGIPGFGQPLHLLGVWAQNANEDNRRKGNPGFLQDALKRYRKFLRAAPAIVAGDFNNHVIWDRPGWRMNHANEIRALSHLGLVSAYHVSRGVRAGEEPEPTLYWRDRSRDGPTYHIDYMFIEDDWARQPFDLTVGRYEDWVGTGLSDHVPLVLEITPVEFVNSGAKGMGGTADH